MKSSPCNRWHYFVQVIAFVVSCLFFSPVFAGISLSSSQNDDVVVLTAAEKKWLQDNPVIKVGGSPDWTPFNFVNEQGAYAGVASDYLQLVAEKTGLRFDVTIDTWSNSLEKIKNSQLDVLSAVYYTEERTAYLNYSRPYFEVLDYFFIRHDLDVTTFAGLSGKRVAVPKAYAHNGLLRKHFPDIQIVTVDTFGQAIDMVLENKADMLYDTYGSLTYTLEKQGINTIVPFKSTRDIVGTNPIHIVTRHDLPELASIIQKGLDAITAAEKRSIYKKWLGLKPVYLEQKNVKRQALELTPEESEWLSQHQSFTFTGDPNWLPFEAFDSRENYIGVVSEYLRLLENKLGIRFEIVPSKTWLESVEKARSGEVDILSEALSSDLASIMLFTEAYNASPVVIVMNNQQAYVENLGQIKEKSIAVINGYGYLPTIIEKYPQLNYVTVDSIQEGLAAVSTGKVDALLATLAQASYHIAELGVNNVHIVGKTEFNTRLSFAVQPSLKPLVPILNKALVSITPAEKQLIYDKWGKTRFSEQVKINYSFVIKVITLFSIVVLVILFWNRKLSREVGLRKEAEKQLKTLVEYLPLSVVVTTITGRVIEANPKAMKDFDVGAADLSKYNIVDFYQHKKHRQEVLAELAAKGSIEQKVVPFKKPDGTVKSMMISIIPIVYHHESCLLAIALDVTERLDMEAALSAAKEKAEKASMAKTEFLANMSHEIRTPMNAIIGFTELLQDEATEPKVKSFSKTIQNAGNSLLLLINDILDLSKIEAGHLEIKMAPVNPQTFFNEIINIFIVEARNKGLELILELDPDIPPSLMLDAARLRQVLLNLIGNAIKFTELGSIRLSVHKLNEDEVLSKLDLAISVEDTGIGIAESIQATIFDPFEQVDGPSQSKGTGLGLAICKRLTLLMGGEIKLKSRIDAGSRFTVTLKNVDVASMVNEDHVVSSDQQTATEFLPANVLIVDDIASNRDLIKAVFEETPLTLLEAENGQQAVNMVTKGKMNLILMDIRMPVMDGYQATKLIKEQTDIPVIALTASVMQDEVATLNKHNFDGYIRKPVLKGELIELMKQFLPYQVTSNQQMATSPMPMLSDHERNVAQHVVPILLSYTHRWKALKESNDISAIKLFVYDIIEIGEEYEFLALLDYANAFLNSIETFDIEGIRQHMTDFPVLISRLES
jgi:two-component system sensor histidine kinase EvgS